MGVYYSRTGNTKFVAEKIAEQLDADLCEIIDKKNRKGKLIYLTGGGFASFREKLIGIEASKSIKIYDFIVVGSPVWVGKITPAIRKFLVSNNFQDKPVAIIITFDGDKPEKTLKNVKETITPKLLIGEQQ